MHKAMQASQIRRNRLLKFSGGMLSAILCVPLAQAATYDFTTISLGYPDTSVNAINDNGAMVGSYYGIPGPAGFLDNAGKFTPINMPATSNFNDNFNSDASGINNSGEIVGSYTHVSGRAQPARFGFSDTAGSFATIAAPLPYGGSTYASGINNQGDIVGTYVTYGLAPDTHGFMLSNNQYTILTVPNSFATYAYGINDKGTIVGQYFNTVHLFGEHGFVDNGGTYTTLDVPGAATTTPFGINNNGVIVGSFTVAGKNVGFVKNGSSYTALNVPGATDTVAYGINDQGIIVGSYTIGTGNYGFMASPLPEASILGQLGAGLLTMGSLQYFRRRKSLLAKSRRHIQ